VLPLAGASFGWLDVASFGSRLEKSRHGQGFLLLLVWRNLGAGSLVWWASFASRLEEIKEPCRFGGLPFALGLKKIWKLAC
jgi:hypothetical protein